MEIIPFTGRSLFKIRARIIQAVICKPLRRRFQKCAWQHQKQSRRVHFLLASRAPPAASHCIWVSISLTHTKSQVAFANLSAAAPRRSKKSWRPHFCAHNRMMRINGKEPGERTQSAESNSKLNYFALFCVRKVAAGDPEVLNWVSHVASLCQMACGTIFGAERVLLWREVSAGWQRG